ncbi:hypothetical protein [Nocardia wallacei]|nr:hypothetical protein [Nocardia wallacei]
MERSTIRYSRAGGDRPGSTAADTASGARGVGYPAARRHPASSPRHH